MSGELVPVNLQALLACESLVEFDRLPDEFAFSVLERWWNDNTQLTYRQQAEDLMDAIKEIKKHGFFVHVATDGPVRDGRRYFYFTRDARKRIEIRNAGRRKLLDREQSADIVDI